MTGSDSGIGMDDRRELAERVDSDLKREEQETGIDWFNTDERATVTTYSATVVQTILKHDEARLNWLSVTDGTDLSGRVKDISAVVEGDAAIEGVQATLPVGCLSIKGSPRRNNRDSGVASTPKDVEEAREAFADGGTCDIPAVGDRVTDKQADGDSDLVIIKTHPGITPGDGRAVELGGVFVGKMSDSDAPLVEAVYSERARELLVGWRSVEDLKDAVSLNALKSYVFPADRLRPAEEITDATREV